MKTRTIGDWRSLANTSIDTLTDALRSGTVLLSSLLV